MAQKIMIENLFKVFGPHPEKALELYKQGRTKNEIMEKTRHQIGVADATFSVGEGEILVIMGLSGSGKSTLVRCINRLIDPSAGKIIVDGEDVTPLSKRTPQISAEPFRHGLPKFRALSPPYSAPKCGVRTWNQKSRSRRTQRTRHGGPGTVGTDGMGRFVSRPAHRRHATARRTGQRLPWTQISCSWTRHSAPWTP